MTDKFISIEGVSKRFPAPGGGATIVFDDLWLSMARGEFVCIIGHSGCGTAEPRATPCMNFKIQPKPRRHP